MGLTDNLCQSHFLFPFVYRHYAIASCIISTYFTNIPAFSPNKRTTLIPASSCWLARIPFLMSPFWHTNSLPYVQHWILIFLVTISNEGTSIITAFKEICSVPFEENGVVFDVEHITAKNITEFKDYHGIRLSILVKMDSITQVLTMDIIFWRCGYSFTCQSVFPNIVGASALCKYPGLFSENRYS